MGVVIINYLLMIDSDKRDRVTMNSSTGYQRGFLYACEERSSRPSVNEGLMYSWIMEKCGSKSESRIIICVLFQNHFKVREFNE